MQRLLLIVNPCAGTKRIPRFFPQIIELFRARGFESTVYMTNGRGDATDIVRERGGDFDRICFAVKNHDSVRSEVRGVTTEYLRDFETVSAK